MGNEPRCPDASSGDGYVTKRSCEDVSRRIFDKLDAIDRRLFKDNGSVSIQTRIDRHEQILRLLLWALGILLGSMLAALGSLGVFALRMHYGWGTA